MSSPGENGGLVIAEVELAHEHQRFEVPPWVGPEVTRQSDYYNSSLAQRPFATWPALLAQGSR
jgi:adenylate cyclase